MKTWEELGTEICDYCNWHTDGRVNTNQYNLCEGRNCDKAYANYVENYEQEE